MHRLSLLLAATFATSAAAQQDYSKVEVKVERVAPGVAVLFGAGGNIGLSYGVDGNVIIDDQFAPLVPKIEAAVKSVDPDPVRFVINTHWHGDHTGGNEALGRAGAVIVARPEPVAAEGDRRARHHPPAGRRQPEQPGADRRRAR